MDERGAELALVSLRQLFDDEIKRVERLVARGRQGFAFAAGFFALAQTVALGSFQTSNLSEHERRVLLLIAAIGGTGVVLTAIAALWADAGLRAKHVSTDSILDAVELSTSENTTAMRLAGLYAANVDAMRQTIRDRVLRVNVAQAIALGTILVVLVELVYSLYHRLT